MPERGQLGVAHRAQIAAEDLGVAFEVAVEAAQHVQERALAAAAFAFHGHELPSAHGQVDAA